MKTISRNDSSDRNGGIDVRVQMADTEVLEIHLAGHLNHHTASSLRGIIDDEQQRVQSRQLVLDCTELAFVDSQAVVLLNALAQQFNALGGGLIIRNPRSMVRKLLETTQLTSRLKIEEDAATPPRRLDLSSGPRVPLKRPLHWRDS